MAPIILGEYRIGVGIFLLNKDKKLWVGKKELILNQISGKCLRAELTKMKRHDKQ